MGRLHAIVLLTTDADRQRAWYGARLGLTVGDDPDTFATRGAALTLRPADKAGIQLVIAVRGLEARVEVIRGRGVEVAHVSGAGEAVVNDPDGTTIRLIEELPASPGRWPFLSHVIINSADLSRSGHFYRDHLGLKVADDTGAFLEMESGDCRLLLHDEEDKLGITLPPEQRVAFALSDDDLDKWAEELRERGVTFITAPMDEELGRLAEVEDPDGWFVLLRGPGAALGREEELAAEYDEDGSPYSSGVRRSLDPGENSQRPGFGSRKLVKRRVERVPTKGFEQLSKGRDDAKGGDLPTLPRTGPSFGPRPGGFSGPRPDRPGFSGPRPDRPGFSGPRPDRPGFSAPRPDRPGFSGQRPDRPGFSGPRPDRPGFSGPRSAPSGPRASGPGQGPRAPFTPPRATDGRGPAASGPPRDETRRPPAPDSDPESDSE